MEKVALRYYADKSNRDDDKAIVKLLALLKPSESDMSYMGSGQHGETI